MTAQYKPYKDQEDFDADQIDENWADSENGGRVQIFDKSQAPKSKRRLIVGGVIIAAVAVIFGFLVGYFGHSKHYDCKHRWSVALHSIYGANRTIADKIIAEVDANELKTMVMHATKTNRLAGLEESRRFTRMVLSNWRKYGLEAELDSYEVLLNYPKVGVPNQVKIVNGDEDIFVAKSIKLQGDDHKFKDEMNPIAAYSASGSAEAEPVYGEYCIPTILKEMEKAYSIQIKGKILICRQLYDNIIEEVVKYAAEAGAVGILFYMDPRDTSSNSNLRRSFPSDAVGMMNARYSSAFDGDPLTPGYPATKDVYRIDQKNAKLPQILVQPISTDDAYNILQMMDGIRSPNTWNGDLNITYYIGPGFKNKDYKLKMQINNEFVNRTIDNVIGVIKGYVEPDRYVIIGAHRDSWRYGAFDNAGGTAVLNELARVYGKLCREGWKPRRTIIFASWDANCFGRIGSNEWVERNYKILKHRAIAYLNIDSVVTGTQAMVGSGSQLLKNAVFNATQSVRTPGDVKETYNTIYKQWLHYDSQKRDIDSLIFSMYAVVHTEVSAGILRKLLDSASDPFIPRYSAINEVSDGQPFMRKLGIPVASFSYSSQQSRHMHKYDTKYDNFANLLKIDPNFDYHVAVTRVYGELLRNLADSLFIPFNLFDYAQNIYDIFIYQARNEKEIWAEHGIDIGILESAVNNFTREVYNFHLSQEVAVLTNPMLIRQFNDMLQLLEQTFVNVHYLPHNILHQAADLNSVIENSGLYSLKNNTVVMQKASPGLDGLLRSMSYKQRQTDWSAFKIIYSYVVTTVQMATKSLVDMGF